MRASKCLSMGRAIRVAPSAAESISPQNGPECGEVFTQREGCTIERLRMAGAGETFARELHTQRSCRVSPWQAGHRCTHRTYRSHEAADEYSSTRRSRF